MLYSTDGGGDGKHRGSEVTVDWLAVKGQASCSVGRSRKVEAANATGLWEVHVRMTQQYSVQPLREIDTKELYEDNSQGDEM